MAVARALDVGVLAASPLAGGVLTGKYRHATPPDSRGASERHAQRLHSYRRTWTRPVIEALCAAAEGLDVSPGSLALAWARDREGITSTIVGARTTHQWRAALDSTRVTLPSEIRQVLDEVAAQAVDLGEDETEG
jgi:aryl-alcohol dehydrogenase-like predicted oxidoreductase